MRRYWETHQDVRAQADLDADPHALRNVCTFEAPSWLNEHYASGQEVVFDSLLSRVSSHGGGRALDVGCGGARWSERLSDAGWEVTGIDLQEALIENNRRRLPHIRFEQVALQEFESDARFSLVCSVTVLGHVPHEDQPRAVEKLYSLTVPGARVIVLENTLDQAPHVFANSPAEWTALFQNAGFMREAVVPYDFNPFTRAAAGLRRLGGRLSGRSGSDTHRPDKYMAVEEGRPSGRSVVAERAYWSLMSLAGAADRRLDPWLTRRAASVPRPVHAGMVFVRN